MKVCIVGTGRSGTTLLRTLLNRHPDLHVIDETHFVPKLFETFGLGPAPLQELIAIVERTRHVRGENTIAQPVSELLVGAFPGAVASVREFCDAVGSRLAAADGKKWWGDKTPDYGPYMGMLQTIWPDCRFVNVVRDGRSVALSMAHHPGFRWMVAAGETWWVWPSFNRYSTVYEEGDGPPLDFLRLWARRLRRIRDEASRLRPGTMLEIRFEDLCVAPERVLRHLAGFAGLSTDVDWLETASRIVDPSRVVERRWPGDVPIPDEYLDLLDHDNDA